MKSGVKRTRIAYEKMAPLAALVILFVISAALSPEFRQFRNLSNILRQVSYTGTIALGMTFVIIAGGIDLSVGSMLALIGGGGILVLNALGGGGWAVAGAVAAAAAGGIAAGALNGVMVTKFRVAPFVATLGTMSIFRSFALYIIDAGEFTSTSELYPRIGSGYALGLPVPVWVWIVLAAIFHVVLNHTRYGRYVCAAGYNEEVARYSAIRVGWVKFFTYVIAGFTVGVTSVMLSSRMNSLSSSTAGIFYELDAIAAVVIGGTSMNGGRGSIVGTVIGAILLGIVNNMLNMVGVSTYLQGAVKGAVIILAVLLQYRKRGVR